MNGKPRQGEPNVRNSALGVAALGLSLAASAASCSDPMPFNPQPISAAGAGSSSGSGQRTDGGSGTGPASSPGPASGPCPADRLVNAAGVCCPAGQALTADGQCIDPGNVNKDCPASQEWLPNTPLLALSSLFKPLQHPAPECPFYRFGFQNFLIATQPDPTTGEAAIVTYPTIDDVFTKSKPLPAGALAAPGQHRGTMLRSWLGDIRQAGQRQIVIDQNGHTLYYGIHVNKVYVDFVSSNGLQTLPDLIGYPDDPIKKSLTFPEGLVEFKSAWTDIDTKDGMSATDNANYVANYITTMAWVPTISQAANGNIVEDKNAPRQIQVALVAIHVVYTIPGHPEFVWASFQHVDSNGNPDSAGAGSVNPTVADPYNAQNNEVVCPMGSHFLLCKDGTTAQAGNTAFKETDLKLDAAKQKFFLAASPATVAQTSIYRMFPGSKSNSNRPDDDVVSLNANMDVVWARAQAQGTIDNNDRRNNYRLVGANWMDKPAFYTIDSPFQNIPETNPLLTGPTAGAGGGKDLPIEQADERAAIWMGGIQAVTHDLFVNGTDSPFSILGGEERMSSTAMESYTQAPASFFNCFTCHNTQAVTANGTPVDKAPTVRKLLKPGLLNVSHILSQFVLEECPGGANQPAACPP
jgi:hypothetical protein